MIAMDINKRPLWYALYDGTEMVTDSNGYMTGEKRVCYKAPVKMDANISAAKGYSEAEVFGTDLQYDRVIVTCDMDCPIDETTVLCIDKEPTYSDGNLLFDYVVKRVAKSLNVISIAVSKVAVTA